ncbi:MAG: TolC family protein [Deltaproteobacteria bacterium]|nr:TolC family protein [Deltaproteobacteria bacterium]
MTRLASVRSIALVLLGALLVPPAAHADPLARFVLRAAPGTGGGAAPTPAPGPDPFATPVEVAGLAGLAGPATPVDLPALLQIAVRQSPTLATASIDIEIAAAQVDATLGLDDWTVGAGLDVSATADRSAVMNGGGRNIAATLSGDLSRLLPSGGTVALHASSGLVNRKSQFTESGLQDPTVWTDTISGSFSQPLMRGRGRAIARAQVALAHLAEDAAALTRRGRALTVVENVVTTYWDLVSANRVLAIAKGSLALAQERFRVTQLGVRGGKIADAELVAVEEAIATRQEDVLNAELAIVQQSVTLRRTIGMEIEPGKLALDPGADLTTSTRNWNLADLREQAMRTSPDLATLATQDRSASLDLEVTENGLLPQLDLALSLGPTGSDITFGGAAKDLVTLGGVSAGASLTYTQSLGKHAVLGQARESRARREKLRLTAVDVRAQIDQALAQAVAQAMSAEQRIALATRAIALAEKSIGIEQSRFELGKSTNFDVLLRQDELRQAQLRLARAQVDWHKAQTVIATVTGSLLDDYGIELAPR